MKKIFFSFLFTFSTFYSIGQETAVKIKHHLSSQKGEMGSHHHQVPKDEKDAGLISISKTAQQQVVNVTDTFNVLVWNVQKMTYKAVNYKEVSGNQYHHLKGIFDNYLNVLNVDFCLLQEVQLNNNEGDNFLLNTNYSFIHSSNYYIPDDSARLGTTILTNKKIDSVQIEQSNVRAFYNTGMSKSATYAWMPLNNDSNLLVVSIHAINIVNNNTFEKHINQVYETIKTHQGPILFAGDFNTWNKTRYKRLKALFSPLDLHITESYKYVGGKRLQWGKHPLDQILTRGITIIDTIFVGELDAPADHAPLTFKFVLE